jgi:hypothetical protein
MTLITSKIPSDWAELETIVTSILNEAGMNARRQVRLQLPRGEVDVDVIADEQLDTIQHTILCECKNWCSNVPRQIVHAFRTVMVEVGAHRGYIISTSGFQAGAIGAAQATNIELVTFEQFQEIHFTKWINRRIKDIEAHIGNFNVYYEPLGKPGFHHLRTPKERDAYDAVWHRFMFAGVALMGFSPYAQMTGPRPFPSLPYDFSQMEKSGLPIPDDIKEATGYREFLALLESYAAAGLKELRTVNPNIRDVSDDWLEEELDAPMPPHPPK